MNVVVYTAVIGNIDELWCAMPGMAHVQHVAFVDKLKTETGEWGGVPPVLLPNSQKNEGSTWEQRIVVPERDGYRRTARHYKTLPHRYFPNADAWLWVDGNIRVRVDPLALIERYPGAFMALKHWRRKCLYGEAAACIALEKDVPATIRAQVARYREEGMPDNWGLPSTGVLIRRNTPAIRELNEAWWAEIEQGSLRDQISLPYVFWKLGLRWVTMPGESPLKGKDNFVHVKHKLREERTHDNYFSNDYPQSH